MKEAARREVTLSFSAVSPFGNINSPKDGQVQGKALTTHWHHVLFRGIPLKCIFKETSFQSLFNKLIPSHCILMALPVEALVIICHVSHIIKYRFIPEFLIVVVIVSSLKTKVSSLHVL